MNHSNFSQNIRSLPKKSKIQLIWFSLFTGVYNLTHTQMCWGIKSQYFLKGGESSRHLGYTQRQCPLKEQRIWGIKVDNARRKRSSKRKEGCGETWFSDSQIQQFAALDSWNQLHPSLVWKDLYLEEEKKSRGFTNLLSLCALEYWSTWKRPSFHFTRQEIFQSMLVST